MNAPEAIRVDICVCTYRRDFVRQTLRSLAALDTSGLAVRVVVTDNDVVPSARAIIEAEQRDLPFPLTYVHAPASNISVARNACLDAASGDFVAFVDDDEVVDRGWLRALVDMARAKTADVVLGPVTAVYDAAQPGWVVDGDFHSTRPVLVNGAIITGYTCNVLIRWTALARAQRFDVALGKSGGEDTEFFSRLHERGALIVEAPDARVLEPVPDARARMGWLMSRRLRAGQTHGAWLGRARSRQRAVAMAVALAKVSYCLVATAVTAPSAVLWRRNFLRATLHFGVMRGLAGARPAVLYGADAVRPA